jgi:hypothetical protein
MGNEEVAFLCPDTKVICARFHTKRRLAGRVVSLDGLTEGLSSRKVPLLTDRIYLSG